MSRSSRKKDISVKDGELLETEVYDGTAARTRPFSIEDILIRRKNKTVNAGAKDGSGDLRNFPGQANGNNPEHDRGYSGKKDTQGTTKRRSRGEEADFSKERGSVKGGDKKRRDLETNSRRIDNENSRVKKHKDEKESYHRSKKEEHQRDDKETSEHKSEWKSPNRSRNDDHSTKEMVRDKHHEDDILPGKETGTAKEHKDEKQREKVMVRAKDLKDEKHRDKEISRAKEHKDEKQHEDMVRTKEKKDGKQRQYRRRNDQRQTDETDTKKEQSGELVGKGTFLDSEMVKSERENRKKHWSREEGRDRAEAGGSAVKKDDSNKHTESAEMKDRNKGTSKPHYEGSGRKRRRSRSREFRARNRSISLSPKGHKRVHEGWEHGESSLHSLKDRKQDSDVDRNRVSSNTEHTSNHSWHHGGRGNRLGGYSPRKRRSETANKTPSPPSRSPEKKNGRWDLPTGSATVPADVQSSHQSVAVNHNVFNGVSVVLKDVGPLSADMLSSVLVSKATDVTVDPVQLTQSTRPLRTLYVENLPASASDKSVMECLNNFLMSSRPNHLQGAQPCISCNINKGKGQALVEFLTAEDATTALSFDGKSFSSSVLKFRRPKDFADTATDVAGKSVPAVEAISDIVNDSPHKIYIGGISKALSSDMLLEIVSAFGRLKAYHFEVDNDLKQPSAYLEYEDKAITPKACAGLNGMKLGGQVLTVLQAFPSLSLEENTGNPPFYGTPEHAKPLLSEPTKVLKLKNVFNAEDFSLLSGSELEETLEDIRIECARFGTVKSINYIKFEKKMAQDADGFAKGEENEKGVVAEAPSSVQEPQENDGKGDIIRNEDTSMHNASRTAASDGDIILVQNEDTNMKVVDELKQGETTELKQEEITELQQEETTDLKQEETTELKQEEITELQQEETTELKQEEITLLQQDETTELKQEESTELKLEETTELNDSVEGEVEGRERVEIKEEKREQDEVFEQGCVFVEYVRSEASCIAAHCLHGRLYGEHSVSVSYIPHDLYLSRFRK
ncbi:hypothetical protein ACHQM5_014175 [Ranunculus cassubicifolius]